MSTKTSSSGDYHAQYLVPGLFLLLLAGLAIPEPVYGQTDPIAEDTDIRPFTAGGSVSMMGQLYSARGISNRRAPAKAQISVNTDFSLFGLQSGLNLFYSTDQSKLRQEMNSLSYNGSYKWLTLRAGDVSPGYSDYGLADATLRGGSVDITPGNFMLKTAVGRAQRAIQPRSAPTPSSRAAFERWIYAGKFGFGEGDGSHFHMGVMYAKDKLNSIDTANIQIRPKENLTITPDVGVTIIDGHLTMNAEVTVSALTRDLTSDKISPGGIGGVFTNIYQPRASSRFSYAGKTNLNAQIGNFSLGLGYSRVQPGFRSLGKHRVQDDHRNIQVSPSFQLLEGSVNINSSLSFGRNNLIGTRLATRKSRNYMINVQTRFTPLILLNTSYNHMLNKTIPTTDTLAVADQRHVTNNIQLQPNITLRDGRVTHTFSITGSWLQSKTRLGATGQQQSTRNITNTTVTTTISYSLTLPSNLSFNGSANYLVNNANKITNRSAGIMGGASYSLFENKLRFSLNTSLNRNVTESEKNRNRETRQLSLNLNTNYQLTSKDTFQLMFQYRNNTIVTGRGQQYTEFQGQFQYSHQF